MAKLTTPIILIDESVVDYGFRVLMSGYVGDQFERNPVLLLQHKRVDDGYQALTNNVVLPLGKWCEIAIKDNALLAFPEFDDNDPFALVVQNKVEKGYLNAASIWIDPIEVSDDEDLKLPGQYGPTITKWGVREASIVDIPNCRNALAVRTSAGKKIQLTGSGDTAQPEVLNYLQTFIKNVKLSIMERKALCLELGLDEKASDAEIQQKLSAVKADATKLTGVQDEVTKLRSKVVELNSAAETAKHESLVDGAITAKKLAAGDRDLYLKLSKADYESTKSLIDKMQPYESVENKLGAGGEKDSAELAELVKLTGRELYLAGKLERLQKLSVDMFKLKYKEVFGVEYAGK